MLKRLVSSGAPALLASGVLLLNPLLGVAFLTPREYATWALAATSSTVALVVDFGGPAFAIRECSRGNLSWRTLMHGSGLTMTGSLLVGLVAALVWPTYAGATDVAAAGWSGSALLLCAAAGSALRGVLVVLASAFLSVERHRVRGVLLVSQALGQTALVAGMLCAGLGIWSLPLAVGVSSLLAVLFGVVRIRTLVVPPLPATTSLRHFALARGALSLLGLSITQLDRWAVGATASPAFLSSFDVVARLGSLPRVAIVGLTSVLVADGAKARTGKDRQALHTRALRVVVPAVLLLSLGVLLLSVLLRLVGVLQLTAPQLLLLVAALCWYGINALTAPTGLLLTGDGHPAAELRYVVPAFTCTLVSWALGLAVQSPMLMIVGSGLSLAAWSTWFLWFGHRYFLSEGGRHDTDEQGKVVVAVPDPRAPLPDAATGGTGDRREALLREPGGHRL